MVKTNRRDLSPSESRAASKQNISDKIHIMETWLQYGVPWELDEEGSPKRDINGIRVTLFVPTSLRSFNSWNSSVYSTMLRKKYEYISNIHGNGTDTLNMYPELKDRAVYLIKSIALIIIKQRDLEGPNRIAILELEVGRLTLFIKNQAIKMLEIQKENISLSKNIDMIERREIGNFSELSKNYSDLENQNSKLKRELSEVKRQLSKVVSFRNVKDERE